MWAMDQEGDQLMRDVSVHGDGINFSEEDFLNGDALCKAIDRELRRTPSTDEQQSDIHKTCTSIVQELKKTLDRHDKKITTVVDLRYRNMTALSWAAARRKIDVVKVLLNFPDANEVQTLLNKSDHHGFIPLHFAAIEGQIEMAHMMLLKSNNPYQLLTAQTEDIWDPISFAYKWCKPKTAEFLKAAKAAYDQGGDQGLRTFLANYELELSQEKCCSCCCTIL